MPIPVDGIFQRDERFVARSVGTRTLLMQVEGAPPPGVHTLLLDGPVALCLWDLLAEAVSRAQLVARVTDEFEVTAAVAEGDVDTFLEQLLAAGCVRAA